MGAGKSPYAADRFVMTMNSGSSLPRDARPGGRDGAIAVVRVAAMLGVVVYHCLLIPQLGDDTHAPTLGRVAGAANGFLGIWAIDTFVFIAGFLYYRIGAATHRYDHTAALLRRKASRLLVPYLFWGLLAGLLLRMGEPSDLLFEYLHLWFLLMLFWVFACFALTRRCWQRLGQRGAMAAFVALLLVASASSRAGLIPTNAHGASLLSLQPALDSLPVFFLGMMSARFAWWRRIPPRPAAIVAAMVLLVAAGVALYALPALPLYSLWRCVPNVLILLLAYRLLSLVGVPGGRVGRMLAFLDRQSMDIYIVHQFLIFLIADDLPGMKAFLLAHAVAGTALLFAVVLALSALLAPAMGRARALLHGNARRFTPMG